MAAAGRGREGEVSALLANGADVRLASHDGSTASAWATKCVCLCTSMGVAIFCAPVIMPANGADVRLASHDGSTASACATKSAHYGAGSLTRVAFKAANRCTDAARQSLAGQHPLPFPSD